MASFPTTKAKYANSMIIVNNKTTCTRHIGYNIVCGIMELPTHIVKGYLVFWRTSNTSQQTFKSNTYREVKYVAVMSSCLRKLHLREIKTIRSQKGTTKIQYNRKWTEQQYLLVIKFFKCSIEGNWLTSWQLYNFSRRTLINPCSAFCL